MNGSIRDWPRFFEQSLRHCKPGGWVECQELDVDARTDDNSFPEDCQITKWCENQEEAAKKAGLTVRISGDVLKKQMEDAGFVNVVSREFKIPIGTWPADEKLREAGAFQLVAMLEGIQGLTLAFWTRFLGWSEEAIEVTLAKVRAEFKSRKIHSYWPLYAAYGQKPTTASET
ncbi:hypothetical protein MMC22_000480 [Lobaria immixta]|nr:hypothetical protein [Lobaria immixta]